MKKLYQIIIFLLLEPMAVNSQKIYVGMETGLGIYSMKGLKSINDEVMQYLPFNVKLVSDFPPFLYYQPTILLKNDEADIGFFYIFQSTGSRISGKDFSGEYRFDMRVKSNSFGLLGEQYILSQKKYQFSIYAKTGVAFSNLKINEYFNLGDSTLINESAVLTSKNYFLEPGLNYTILKKSLSFGINIGYLFNLSLILNRGYQDQNIPEWNGFRIGLSVYYTLYK
jgi:hypothetical protein